MDLVKEKPKRKIGDLNDFIIYGLDYILKFIYIFIGY